MKIDFPLSRVLLKLSGEIFYKENKFFNQDLIKDISKEIKKIVDNSIQIAIVMGGGNIIRGSRDVNLGIDRRLLDEMGMFATFINALFLKDILKREDVDSVIMSSSSMGNFVEKFNTDKALKCLSEGKVLLLPGGTGLPLFTTDTASALRAFQLNVDLLLKATKVDGVYDKDPVKFKDAKKFKLLDFHTTIKKELKIMDLTAFKICMENNIPIIVFNIFKVENLSQILINKEIIGTLIK